VKAKCDLSPQKEHKCNLCAGRCEHFLSVSPWMFQMQQRGVGDFGTMMSLLRFWEYKGRPSLKDVEVQVLKVCPFLVQMRHTAAEGLLLAPLQKGGFWVWKGVFCWMGRPSLGVYEEEG
jgi:hypothetical protein